nr:nuclear transport factor 2 family protein [uncultured Psychroserpens sp.]
MRLFKILFTIIILFNFLNCKDKSTTHKDSKITEDSLLETIEKFNNAFQEGNVSIIESMVTENYIHTNGNSKAIRKKDWLNYLKKREKKIKSGNLEVIEYKMNEIEIEFYNKIAIVTGKIFVSNKEKEDIKNSEYRITNIWVNENGKWKRAGFHDGKIE